VERFVVIRISTKESAAINASSNAFCISGVQTKGEDFSPFLGTPVLDVNSLTACPLWA
jgi:hypothetical protein